MPMIRDGRGASKRNGVGLDLVPPVLEATRYVSTDRETKFKIVRPSIGRVTRGGRKLTWGTVDVMRWQVDSTFGGGWEMDSGLPADGWTLSLGDHRLARPKPFPVPRGMSADVRSTESLNLFLCSL